jgi:hypothetical protein
MTFEELQAEAARATGLLKGRCISRVVRPSAREIGLDFTDGVRVFVDSPTAVELSVTGGAISQSSEVAQPVVPADRVHVELSKSEALVLFDLLSRFSNTDELATEHISEERVLWDLCARLERALVEPFEPDWPQLLGRAREQVSGS